MHCVRHALVVQTPFTINILNYRKNGTRFVNRLRMRPIFDEQGKLTVTHQEPRTPLEAENIDLK